ncbi:MAG: hypothetical protein IAE91_08455 [Ignavibacteriaceae bacterium]|nr:hypothetical protein [Ignavibacteriaceae bacterium]
MKNIANVIKYSIREALSSKILISYLALSLLIVVVVLIAVAIKGPLSYIDENIPPEILETEKTSIINIIFAVVAGFLSFFTSFLAIFPVAGFVPGINDKGSLDMLLSKPVGRSEFLTGRYLGGLLIVGVNFAFVITAVWLIISVSTSIWNPSFLYIIPFNLLSFAALYALMFPLGLITGSNLTGILTYFILLIIVNPLLLIGHSAEKFTGVLKTVISAFYYVLPKTAELGSTALDSALKGDPFSQFLPLITTLAFTVLVFLYGIFIFEKKDF